MAERDAAELARLRAKVDYWTKKDRISRPKKDMLKFETDFIASIPIDNPNDARHGTELNEPVYRAGTVAEILDKSTQSVRLYERQGVIPPTGIWLRGSEAGKENRGYTYDQVRALLDLVELLNFSDTRGNHYSIFSRELWKAWAKMPDGVVVEPKEGVDPADATNLKGRKRRKPRK